MDGPVAGPDPSALDASALDRCGLIATRDVRTRGDRIVAVGPDLAAEPGDLIRDAAGLTMLPGFVQGHLHCCQTLFRGLADDLPLMRWLRERIWPLEAAHDPASIRASARLSLAELLRSGTTAIQAIETVRHTEETFAVCEEAGLTAIVGNCLMDLRGDGVPDGLPASARDSLRISEELCRAHHGRGRLQYAVSPRFVLSCSDGLARDAAAFAAAGGLRVHTHASEHREEIAAVAARFGRSYLRVLDDQGLLGRHSGLAHCVHLDADERQLLQDSGAAVLHCPSANLKLGSGIAPIAEYARRGIRIALGADGAPCNNRLSALTELRQAALLQALAAGPGAWPAAAALWAMTRGGALALGLDDLGSIAVGQRADLLLFDLRGLDLGAGSPVSQLVYSAAEPELRHVVVGGRDAVVDGELRIFDAAAVAAEARDELGRLLGRAGLAR
jgi:5-methylthioadenosine/S-adenosylhomocysteine deaminase